MVLVIDLRCLQDPNYVERGIGSHARNLAKHAPGRWVGVYDPRLPMPEVEAPELSPHAYVQGATVFLNPSPFTPNQEFCARLLTDERVLKAVCVHDFIPYDAPERYLRHPLNRLDYFAGMAWLRRYDVYLPNSVPTDTRLRELYGAVRSVVTGVALAPLALGIEPEAPRHILMVGGDDARKNPEVLRRAWEMSPALRRWPLVITGGAEPPGRVSNEALRRLYAQAALVVTPSRAEGFSLPVLEGIAAGAPSIASDIAAHRALLGAAYLFPPEDPAALAALAADVLARRDEVVAAQAGLSAPYTAEKVAARVFGALPCAPAVLRRTPPRVAVLSPLPPARSGIAQYTSALLPELRRLARVDVFSGLNIAPLEGRFDAVLGVVGNAPLHADAYELLCRRGGAVLCHDARLPGLLGPRAAAVASAELGRAVSAAEVAAWEADENQRQACFLGEIAAVARPLIVHARETVEVVARRFGVRAAYLPFAVQQVFTPVPKAQARAALGLGEERIAVSFGFVTRGKAVRLAQAAAARAGVRLVFAGEAEGEFAGLGTGYLSARDYELWLSAADVALHLREGTGGNISGALQDAIVAGLPCVATAALADALEAPEYVARVSHDVDEIAAALNAPAFSAEARDAYVAAHAMADYARSLLALLSP